MKHEFLDHTADIKFKVYGKSLSEIFSHTANALFEVFTKKTTSIKTKEKLIQIQGTDLKNLLYQFIDEIIYLADTEYFITSNAQVIVDIKTNTLKGSLLGDDAKNYSELDHIKAATYAEMEIKQTKAGWEAQAVVDV